RGAPFVAAPAEVRPPPRAEADRAVVHLLPRALADVGDVEVPCQPVEREAPGVAKTVRPDLGIGVRSADERVVGRNPVRVPVVLAGIDPQDLPAPVVQILSVVVRIAGAAAVTRADVEEPVGSELELAAVVVRLVRMRDGDHQAARAEVGDIWVESIALELIDGHRTGTDGRAVDAEEAARG